MSGRAVRARACELAAGMVALEGIGDNPAERVWAYAVLFQSYIEHGPRWVHKHMIEGDARSAAVLRLVPKPLSDGGEV